MHNEQEMESEVCPWKAVIEQFPAEFMQFFYPAAWQEIDWSVQSALLAMPANSIGPGSSGELATGLEMLLQVYLRSGQRCRLYLFLTWAEQEAVDLTRHIYRNQCQMVGTSDEPVAIFVILGGRTQPFPAVTSIGWECLGNQLGLYFPCVHFSDFAGQESALLADDNAFALLTMVQLVAQQTSSDMALRYSAKWELIQSMFGRGWSRDRIIVLFQALDWSLPLPLRWSARLWRDIEQFEEQQIMRYVSSVERFVRERERQQGYQQGEATMLQHLLEHRFGELPLWVGMQIRNGSGEQRVAWLQRALAARNLDDVFHDGP